LGHHMMIHMIRGHFMTNRVILGEVEKI